MPSIEISSTSSSVTSCWTVCLTESVSCTISLIWAVAVGSITFQQYSNGPSRAIVSVGSTAKRSVSKGDIVKTKAAVLWEVNAPWSVEEIELDAPGPNEVLVKMAASGLCHSDEHVVTGDLPFELPMVGGHEGAGVVQQVGTNVSWLAPGDHVVFGFIPSCGRCVSCSTGHQNLCDLGAYLGSGKQISDQTSRHHAGGKDLGVMCLLGTFAQHTVVHEASCIKIEKDVPLDRACLLGCGVVTGWGSSVYAAEVKPGDTVVVVGVGGIGANAIQGARIAGAKRIIAIDPIEFKREKAMEFGYSPSEHNPSPIN